MSRFTGQIYSTLKLVGGNNYDYYSEGDLVVEGGAKIKKDCGFEKDIIVGGNVYSQLVGDVFGDVFGNVKGNIKGDVSGNIKSNYIICCKGIFNNISITESNGDFKDLSVNNLSVNNIRSDILNINIEDNLILDTNEDEFKIKCIKPIKIDNNLILTSIENDFIKINNNEISSNDNLILKTNHNLIMNNIEVTDGTLENVKIGEIIPTESFFTKTTIGNLVLENNNVRTDTGTLYLSSNNDSIRLNNFKLEGSKLSVLSDTDIIIDQNLKFEGSLNGFYFNHKSCELCGNQTGTISYNNKVFCFNCHL